MLKESRIYVAGHNGMVGASIVRLLEKSGYRNIITATSKELDLRRQSEVELFFERHKPDYVFLAAARVGGIWANSQYPAVFGYDNLMIELNCIQSAYLSGVKKLLFLGSSCIYPRMAPQPIAESALLGGYLEKTNEAYAIAKIAGLKLCQYYNQQYKTDYISAMPTNLYGPGDNYHPENSHVLPALISRFHEAKINKSPEVTIWGSGKPLREFLYVDDLAQACLFLMNEYSGDETVNVGTGQEISIGDLARLIAGIVGYTGKIRCDASKPDGTPRKLLDVSKINDLGWGHKISLSEGIQLTYENYLREVHRDHE